MKRCSVLCLLLLPFYCATLLGVEPAQSNSDGFIALFNGKDFTGWRFSDASAVPAEPPVAWKIDAGTIVGLGDANAILASQWDYGNFELEFEWRATQDDYDADLYIHSGRLLHADPIRLKQGLDGGPQENDRGEGGYNASPSGQIGGSGKARKAVPELQKPVGEWNAWKITVRGSTHTLTCNGQEAWNVDDHVLRRGYLGFRVFKGPLEIRNVRLRETDFRSLMNLADWEVYPGYGGAGPLEKHWTTDGDVWTFKGEGPSIVTKKKDYANYELRAEFLFADPDPEMNTGIYLRGVHPWQVEVWQHKWGCGLWGILHGAPEMGKAIPPSMRMENPSGQWNYLEARVENHVVSVWLNGRTTIDRYPIKQVDNRFPDQGGIALQAHYPWKEIRFRNLRVKSLE